MLRRISEWIADVCRWLWQAYLIAMMATLVIASVIITVTGIVWCVIKLLTYLP